MLSLPPCCAYRELVETALQGAWAVENLKMTSKKAISKESRGSKSETGLQVNMKENMPLKKIFGRNHYRQKQNDN